MCTNNKKLFSVTSISVFSTLMLGVCLFTGNTFIAGNAFAEESWGIEEITVVARRREESLQDTPISVSAFTDDALRQRSITGMKRIAEFTPNLEINNGRPDSGGSSSASVTIRGVGQNDALFPLDPGVGMYVNGVYMGRALGGMMGLNDIERVEVLRGPQGTLYGRNTIGGAINVITPKPEDEFSGKFEITAGSEERLDFNGHINFPLGIEGLNARISAAKLDRDGYVERPLAGGEDLGNEDKTIIRAAVGYETSNLDIQFVYDYTDIDQSGLPGSLSFFDVSDAGFILGLYNPLIVPAIAAQFGLPATTAYDARWEGDFDTSFGTGQSLDKNKIHGASLTIDWSVREGLNFKSITSYRDLDTEVATDQDHSPLPVASTAFDLNQDQFSQEIHIMMDLFDNRLKLLLGGFYFNEDAAQQSDVVLGGFTFQVAPFLFGPPPPLGLPPVFDLFQPDSAIDSESWAGFFHGTYQVNDSLSLTAGLRYTREEKIYSQDFRNGILNVQITGPRTLEETWNALTPKFGIDYKLTDESLLYFSAARGFKSGGWDPRAVSNAAGNTPFEPEFAWTFEVGSKNKFMDNRLLLNAAFFYSDYTDLHRQVNQSGDVPGAAEIRVFNAASAEIYGLELEILAVPTEQITLGSSVGYTHAEYSELDPAGVPFTIDDQLQDTPEWTLSLFGQYTHPLGEFGDLNFMVDGSYRSETFKEPQNLAPLRQPGYWLANSRMEFTTTDGLWNLAVFVTNIFDEEYITNGGVGPGFGVFQTYYGRPREFGVSLARSF